MAARQSKQADREENIAMTACRLGYLKREAEALEREMNKTAALCNVDHWNPDDFRDLLERVNRAHESLGHIVGYARTCNLLPDDIERNAQPYIGNLTLCARRLTRLIGELEVGRQ